MSENVNKEQLDKVDKAIDNIEWAKDASMDGELLKSNSHLHRAEELLQEYKDQHQ